MTTSYLSDTSDQSEIGNNEDKLKNIRDLLETDIDGCDIKFSLFVAAAQSYRHDSQLKPFPPNCITKNAPDIDRLLKIIQDTPSLGEMLIHIKDKKTDEIKSEVIELIHWVLVSAKDARLQSIPKSDVCSHFIIN